MHRTSLVLGKGQLVFLGASKFFWGPVSFQIYCPPATAPTSLMSRPESPSGMVHPIRMQTCQRTHILQQVCSQVYILCRVQNSANLIHLSETCHNLSQQVKCPYCTVHGYPANKSIFYCNMKLGLLKTVKLRKETCSRILCGTCLEISRIRAHPSFFTIQITCVQRTHCLGTDLSKNLGCVQCACMSKLAKTLKFVLSTASIVQYHFVDTKTVHY